MMSLFGAAELRRARYLASLIALCAVSVGCEYAFSDVATRIRYALVDEDAKLRSSKSETAILTLEPDHWPDGCRKGAGYRLVLSPYKGGKQVPVGDVDVYCNDGRRYYTGFGSEHIYVAREMVLEKKAGEKLVITLRRTAAGSEIVELK